MKRVLAAAAAALVLFCAVACRRPPCDPVGTWEGVAGDSLVALTFRETGEASVAVTAEGQMSTTYCRWTRLERRICLTNTRGQVRWFAILGCARNELTLRIAEGRTGVCRLRRTDGRAAGHEAQ